MRHQAENVNKNVMFLKFVSIQSTRDNSNLQGKSKKGLSYREFELTGVRRK